MDDETRRLINLARGDGKYKPMSRKDLVQLLYSHMTTLVDDLQMDGQARYYALMLSNAGIKR